MKAVLMITLASLAVIAAQPMEAPNKCGPPAVSSTTSITTTSATNTFTATTTSTVSTPSNSPSTTGFISSTTPSTTSYTSSTTSSTTIKPSSTTSSASPTATVIINSPGNKVDQSLCLQNVNQFRSQKGQGALRYDSRLEQLATYHSTFMFTTMNFTTWNANGTLGERLDKMGVQHGYADVDIGIGFSNATEAVDAWTTSSRHVAKFIDATINAMACAYVDDWWTVNVAAIN
ncbi:hypothetical protein H4R33_007095 [Dimargaris cristalligena]|nr:hypothetical protein H4R33_007095 [Dimargaris cristalligena]